MGLYFFDLVVNLLFVTTAIAVSYLYYLYIYQRPKLKSLPKKLTKLFHVNRLDKLRFGVITGLTVALMLAVMGILIAISPSSETATFIKNSQNAQSFLETIIGIPITFLTSIVAILLAWSALSLAKSQVTNENTANAIAESQLNTEKSNLLLSSLESIKGSVDALDDSNFHDHLDRVKARVIYAEKKLTEAIEYEFSNNKYYDAERLSYPLGVEGSVPEVMQQIENELGRDILDYIDFDKLRPVNMYAALFSETGEIHETELAACTTKHWEKFITEGLEDSENYQNAVCSDIHGLTELFLTQVVSDAFSVSNRSLVEYSKWYQTYEDIPTELGKLEFVITTVFENAILKRFGFNKTLSNFIEDYTEQKPKTVNLNFAAPNERYYIIPMDFDLGSVRIVRLQGFDKLFVNSYMNSLNFDRLILDRYDYSKKLLDILNEINASEKSSGAESKEDSVSSLIDSYKSYIQMSLERVKTQIEGQFKKFHQSVELEVAICDLGSSCELGGPIKVSLPEHIEWETLDKRVVNIKTLF